jgi:hypothetical protein
MSHGRAVICFTCVFSAGSRKEVEAIAVKLGTAPHEVTSNGWAIQLLGGGFAYGRFFYAFCKSTQCVIF